MHVCDNAVRSEYNTAPIQRVLEPARRGLLVRNHTVHPICLNAMPHLALAVLFLHFCSLSAPGRGQMWCLGLARCLCSSCPCAPSLLAAASRASGDDL